MVSVRRSCFFLLNRVCVNCPVILVELLGSVRQSFSIGRAMKCKHYGKWDGDSLLTTRCLLVAMPPARHLTQQSSMPPYSQFDDMWVLAMKILKSALREISLNTVRWAVNTWQLFQMAPVYFKLSFLKLGHPQSASYSKKFWPPLNRSMHIKAGKDMARSTFLNFSAVFRILDLFS